jgi:mRNA interferase MazF
VRTASDVQRGEIWWADLPEPRRSEAGFPRPVLIVQADTFNRSAIQTLVVAVITGNTRLGAAPGNVFLPADESGLPKDSIITVSQVLTIDRSFLSEHVSKLPSRLQASVDAGLRLVLEL